LSYSLLSPESASILWFIVFFFGNPVLQRQNPHLSGLERKIEEDTLHKYCCI